ncbi:arginyltransferase [Minwuia thermotolerans]|uniref:Aspartate/glutamate leucyltransferase n=1 Tax=Minwuia thermotolerans TaxID=2056226 RepID=A0A2M9FXF2_9PROT|nr:arginyltransferase [Minwuia thermotolerans]PJK28119.1 arginyltransferase [Minwuia thermotolerans]
MKRVQIPLRHFFATPPTPCPYLSGKMERKVVTLLSGEEPDHLHSVLSTAGFRRSQDLAYRPACDDCNACVPVRIPAERFRPNRTQRKNWRRNSDLKARIMPAVATREHYILFRQYLSSRHAEGGMAEMRFGDYRAMIEDTPVDSCLVEFRDREQTLRAVCLTDRMQDGFSLVYSYFRPSDAARSLGTYIVQWHVQHAIAEGLDHVYLGYWIADSRKMSYKSAFRPLEQLTADGWEDLGRGEDSADQFAN